ncbi:MAG TPA: alpha-amylase family glycosyl hydrolase [Ignavibacteriaceae bacterium]|nr:alpha-amylase family glycosyl hydrolase [Ignavibacteriaceae bacterium]
MKKFFTASFILLFFSYEYPQVTTIPEFPTENDSIVVFLDATQPGAEELLNYSGTVYAHTGVNTALADWQHVIGSWGNNSTQPALTRLSTNTYKLVIGHPRKFYNVAASEKIKALAFVFRTSDGSKQTRPDIFIDLYEPGLTVNIDAPEVSSDYGDPLRSPHFAKSTDTVDINISAVEIGTKVSTLTLFVNGSQVGQASANQLSYKFIAGDYPVGQNVLRAVGIDTAGISDTSEFAIMINPPVINEPLPPGVEQGINYVSSTTVTLALFAPYKNFVYVLGDFNDWKVDTSYYMRKYETDSNNVIWWLTINNINPGEEFAFQYLVDGNLRIADPYTEKILDPSNDQYISSSTYPNLKQYPDGKTSEIVSVFQTDQVPYEWQAMDFKRPAKTDLVIYELLIRDFVSTHNYNTLIDTLGYLKTLGINAVELMPIMEFSGNESWGYNPIFHAAPDKYYGTKDDLKKFIDAAHQNGIAVILDIALNQIDNPSPLARLYWDSANNRPAANNPWLNPVAKHPYNVFNDINHESSATKYYVDRVNKYWITQYHIDGFRFDLSKGFTQKYSGSDVGLWGQYDQSRINILERMADKIWETDSSFYVILEHFADNNEEIVLSNYGMMLWGNMNYNYNEATMGWLTNSDFSWGSYKARGWGSPNLISYMESHDEERLMYKNIQFGNSSGSYSTRNLGTALNRIKLAAAFFFTIPGPKMLWQFGELGYDVSIDFNGRTGNKPLKWDYLNEPARKNLFKVFSALINLKKNYDAFRSTSFATNLSGAGKRISITDSSMDVTIFGNFNVQPIEINPSFQNTGIWYDYFSGDSINVSDAQSLISLEAGEFHIYTTKKLPAPEPDILLAASYIDEAAVKEYYLGQNYPNPFNPSTEIMFQITNPSWVSLKIYDVLGREVKNLVNGERRAGRYTVRWNGDNNFSEPASSGIYFYKLDAGSFSSTKKMMLIR